MFWMAPERLLNQSSVIQKVKNRRELLPFLLFFFFSAHQMRISFWIKELVWAVGITTYELCVGSPPYFDSMPSVAFSELTNFYTDIPLPKTFSPELQNFLERALAKIANNRANLSDLAKHPFLNRACSKQFGDCTRQLHEMTEKETVHLISLPLFFHFSFIFPHSLLFISNLQQIGCNKRTQFE
jgi:serine/threonine protein kinase